MNKCCKGRMLIQIFLMVNALVIHIRLKAFQENVQVVGLTGILVGYVSNQGMSIWLEATIFLTRTRNVYSKMDIEIRRGWKCPSGYKFVTGRIGDVCMEVVPVVINGYGVE